MVQYNWRHGTYPMEPDVSSIGDSSPADDGTGDTNDNPFNSWSGDAPSGYTSHPALHINASLWLAKIQSLIF